MSGREPALPGKPVTDPACWTGDELAARDDWIFELTDGEIAGLEAMAGAVRQRIGDDPNGLIELGADDFDLGPLAPRLAEADAILKDGVGIVLFRALPLQRWDMLAAAIVFWAIGRQVGDAQSNNPEGEMIAHVTDMGKDLDHPNHRAYQTSAELFFHVDQTDILGLLCLTKAKSGGRSKIASSIAIHNEMLARRPDLAEVLAQPFHWSRMGEEGPDQDPWFKSPVFNYVDGYLSVTAGYKSIEKGHRLPGVPPLSEIQKEALNYFEELGDELQFATELEPGDVAILNNQALVHSRTGFEDWPEPERHRRLWRLWLKNAQMRPRSPFVVNYTEGVWPAQMTRRIELEPGAEYRV